MEAVESKINNSTTGAQKENINQISNITFGEIYVCKRYVTMLTILCDLECLTLQSFLLWAQSYASYSLQIPVKSS